MHYITCTRIVHGKTQNLVALRLALAHPEPDAPSQRATTMAVGASAVTTLMEPLVLAHAVADGDTPIAVPLANEEQSKGRDVRMLDKAEQACRKIVIHSHIHPIPAGLTYLERTRRWWLSPYLLRLWLQGTQGWFGEYANESAA